ncbi:MAG: helix-turn-helix domain-containing protein [Alphaproteobacteria bacterium]|nr:helix-turn-helix domain-containing protein [Alphaproteobacteria bacterium]
MTTIEKFRIVKKHKGWSQEDIALKLNVSLATVKAWFKKNQPNNPKIWVAEQVYEWYERLESEGKI